MESRLSISEAAISFEPSSLKVIIETESLVRTANEDNGLASEDVRDFADVPVDGLSVGIAE